MFGQGLSIEVRTADHGKWACFRDPVYGAWMYIWMMSRLCHRTERSVQTNPVRSNNLPQITKSTVCTRITGLVCMVTMLQSELLPIYHGILYQTLIRITSIPLVIIS
jgi:hypothetical protein